MGKVALDNLSSQALFGNGAYGNLQLVEGEADLVGSPTINGTLTLPSSPKTGLFDVGANTLTLNGPTIAGTAGNLVADFSSSLVFGGSFTGVQIPSSVTELNGLTINNANGVTLNANLAIGGTLTLTSGVLNAPSYLVDVQNADNGSVIRTGGWLYGTLGKYFAVGTAQSFTFWVGDAGTCRQMSYTMNVTGAGSIRMQLISGADPQAATSGLNPAKTLPFYWQRIAKGRVAFANLTVIRYFGATAESLGVNYALLMDRSWSSDSSSWENRPIIERLSTSISVYGVVRAPTSNVDSYTDFVDGEQLAGAYQITANTGTPAPGAGDQLTITLVDAVGVPVSYTGDKNLTFSGLVASADGTHSPSVTDKGGTAQNLSVTTPITFANGVSSVGGSLVAYRPGARTLNVQDDASTPLSSTSAGGFGVSVNVQNAAPVPAAYPVTRNKGAGVMFKVADLLAACSDANYDSLSLSSVATSSANGGTVAHNATWILYTPGSSSASGDTFTYTISDGTTTADGTVTVSVTQPSGQSANMFALTFDSGNHPVVSFAGIRGRSYGIQRADAANGSYVTKTTVQVPETGSPIVTWTDETVTGGSYFYRTVSSSY